VVRDGAFHPGAIEEGWRATGGDRTAIEARLNRVVLREEVSDPDPEILHEVAVALAASWRATLREAFPARAFDVGITADGDEAPIVWAASRRM
jgi:hypothetical protein